VENLNRQTSHEHKLYKNIEGRYSDLDYEIKVNIIDRETAIKQKEHEKYQMQSIDVELSELSRQRKHLHSKAANVDINNILEISSPGVRNDPNDSYRRFTPRRRTGSTASDTISTASEEAVVNLVEMYWGLEVEKIKDDMKSLTNTLKKQNVVSNEQP